MPKYPQHPRCQCRFKKIAKPIPYITAKATYDIRKFTEYVFSDKYDDGKRELFERWGYTIKNSEYLQQLYVSQAMQKYCDGDYVFKGVVRNYTRVEIVIALPVGNGQTRKIKTGWILLPKGEIKLSTPFTGFENEEKELGYE